MKKTNILITAIVFLFVSSTAIAGQFGAPQPAAKEGFSLGVGYFLSQNKWEPRDNTEDKDYKMTRNEVYVQASGASKYMEGFIRLGGADMELEDGKGPGNDFKDSGVIFGTIGARGIFPVNSYFGIGPIVQASLYDDFKDNVGSTTIKFKNPWEIAAALAFQGNIGNNLILYAGPYLFWSQFDVDGGQSWEAKNVFGGMGGLRFTFNKTFSLEVEAQYANELSAGGMFTVSF